MYTILVVGGIFVCIGALIAYLIITFIAPEWIGISSKKARIENKEEKEDSTKPPKDFFSS